MKNRNIFLITILSIFLSSCSTLKKTMFTASAPLPNVELTNDVKTKVVVDKSKVLSGTSVSRVTLGIFKSGDNKFADLPRGSVGNKTKKAAIFKALDGTDNDIIINPKFEVEVSKSLFTTKTTVKVEGYGARYVIQ